MRHDHDDGKSAQFDQYADSYTDLHRSSIAASGEEPAYFSAYKADYMAARGSSDRSIGSILDFGCGVGNSIPHLRAAFPSATIHGCDPSGESIAVAESKFGNVAQFNAVASSMLPYPDGAFDLVLVACVLHHIPVLERQAWMSEIHRVTRPGGRVFVFEHNMLNPVTRKVVRDCPFDEDAVFLPRKEVLGLARGSGFSSVVARYVVFFPRPLAALRGLEPMLGWLPLGAQYVVMADA